VFISSVGNCVVAAGEPRLRNAAPAGLNVIWEPVIVVFNNAAAVHRITTLSDLTCSDVSQPPLPQLDFHGSAVSAAACNRGTPAPGVTPAPQ
jgi:hypothetical protein